MSRPSLSERVYRRLLRLFPVDFREEYRAEMEDVFRRQHRDAIGGAAARQGRGRRLARLWVRAFLDLARSAPREHLDALRHDVRFTLRGARRAPGFTALVVLTFALAIGANSSVFTVAHATLLRPLPFADDARLVRLVHVRERPDGGVSEVGLSRRDYHAAAAAAESLAGVAAQIYQGPALRTGDGIERVTAIGVSGSWFRTLGVRPALGRTWSADEEAVGDESRVVVLSHALWQRRFGGDPGVLGETAVLDGAPHTVVGVMPAGFQYPYGAELWRLWSFDPHQGASHILNVQARLAPGVSLDAAQAELDLLSERQAAAHPDSNRGFRIVARPTRDNLIGGEDRLVLLLTAGVGLVLLLAAVNVISLLVVRTLARARELAVRAALGASAWRRTRQLVTENVVLALAGGAAGLALATALRGSLLALLPEGIRQLFGTVPFDHTVYVFGVALSLLVGAAVGLVAGRGARAIDLRGVLHGSFEGPRGRRVLAATVVVETAVTAALLVGALLLSFDLHRLATRHPGFETRGLLAATLSLPEEPYAQGTARLAFEQEAVRRIRALPGVEEAAIANLLPYHDGNWLLPFELDGEPLPPAQAYSASLRQVTPGYFRTLGIPLLRGRPLRAADRAGSQPVVVVDRSFAARYWPGEDPVGQVIRGEGGSFDGRPLRVVGVVGDVEDPRREPAETVYVAMAQTSVDSTAYDIVQPALAVRTSGPDPAALVPSIRAALESVAPGVPLFDVRTAEAALGDALSQRRTATLLALVFGACGLLLAAVGTYGMIAFVTCREVRGFAVRLAVGAARRQIFLGVLLRGGRLVAAGVALGLAAAAWLSPLLAGALQASSPTDPGPYVAAAALLALIGLAACLQPALRATATDPVRVLRDV